MLLGVAAPTRMHVPVCAVHAPRRQVPGEPEGVTYGAFVSEAGMDKVAKYASGVGPWKNTIIEAPAAGQPNLAEGASLKDTGFVARAHARGMQVHPYTWRAEASYLRYGNFSSIAAEYER